MLPSKSILKDEKGIALISALLITLILTLVVIALAYRVGLFSVGTREHVIKSQSVYTADAGLNKARYSLLEMDCMPPNWNACIPGINSSTFVNISSSIKKAFKQNMQFTVGDQYITYNTSGEILRGTTALPNSDNYKYEVHAKATNIPKVINVLVSAERAGQQTKTVIDAGLLFTLTGNEYKQLGGVGADKAGVSGESLGNAAGSTDVRTQF